MKTESRCLICLKELGKEEPIYHPSCCKKLFGTSLPPELPYSWNQLNKLAEKIIRLQVTVPGVQPKLSLHLERSGSSRSSRFTLVSMQGGYILKPPVKEYTEMPELEHLTMLMASMSGISCASCGLIKLEEGQQSFITKRMDRIGEKKLHMEDMCQLTDRMTEQKYRGSMEQTGRAVLKHCSNPIFDALRLFEVTLFCFLTGNSDMHLKNFSLLRDVNKEIHLSPAYDLLPTNIILPEDTEESALTINGKKRKLNANDFLSFGSKLHLTEAQLKNAFKRILTKTTKATELINQSLCSKETKEKFHTLITQRMQRLNKSV